MRCLAGSTDSMGMSLSKTPGDSERQGSPAVHEVAESGQRSLASCSPEVTQSRTQLK